MKYNLKILENTNELINIALSLSNVSIACESLAEGGQCLVKANEFFESEL